MKIKNLEKALKAKPFFFVTKKPKKTVYLINFKDLS